MISLKQIYSDLKSVFDNTRVQMIDSVYERSLDKKYYKLVFSIHSLDVKLEDDEKNTIILHTKFIFRVNNTKTSLVENSFWYLKDINCKYVKVDFNSNLELVEKLEGIIKENSFGKNMKVLSHFISEAPSSSINDFLSKNYTDEFSVTNVTYNPSLKMAPCKNTTFDFDFELNNGENYIKLSIKKDGSIFRFFYYIEDQVEEIESEYLGPIPQIVGDHLQFLYNKFLK